MAIKTKNLVQNVGEDAPAPGAVAPHTPGPWVIDFHPKSSTLSISTRYIRGPDGGGIAAIHGDRISCGANARLIAAAPELLAALQGAIGALEFSRDYHSDLGNEEQAFCQDKLDAATKAVARATGQ